MTGQKKQPAVVSSFFNHQTTSSSSQPSRSASSKPGTSSINTGLGKHPSIISLSDGGSSDDDDGIQVVESKSSKNTSATVPSKRPRNIVKDEEGDEGDLEEIQPASKLKRGEGGGSSPKASQPRVSAGPSLTNASTTTAKKEIKVAPLFAKAARAANNASTTNTRNDSSAATIDKLQQWKQSPTVAGPPSSAVHQRTVAQGSSSSPLPEAPVRTTQTYDDALAAQRAAVRAKLLGSRPFQPASDDGVESSADRRSPAEGEDADERLYARSTDSDDVSEDDMRDSESHSSSTLSHRKKGKATSTSELQEPSKFAKFAAAGPSISSDDTGVSAKKKGKGKAKREEKATDITYTPLEQQVLALKARYPDTMLIIEVGYKFKFFGEDAKVAAKELSIACFPSGNFHTAMIPVHRLQVHIKRLITSGYKVGVVRQKETAALKKAGDNKSAPFTRELTDLYTAATYVEGLDDDTVTGAAPTYGTILCICEESRGGKGTDERVLLGLVAAQPSTGEVVYDQFEDGFLRNELETRLLHIQPGELVAQGVLTTPTQRVIQYVMTQDARSSSLAQGRIEQKSKDLSSSSAVSLITKFYKKAAKADVSSPAKKKKVKRSTGKGKAKDAQVEDFESDDEMLIDLTQTSLEAEGDESLADDPIDAGQALATVLGLPEKVIIAFAGLLQHLQSFHLDNIFERPKFFTPFAQRGSMLLNANTLANLEIFRNQTDYTAKGSLFSILNHTKTPFGERMLRRWVSKPLLQMAPLQERIEAVDQILNSNSYLLGKMRGLFKGLPDLERGLARIHYGKSTPQELVRVMAAFQRIANEFDLPADMSTSSVGFKSTMLNNIYCALPKLKPVVESILQVLDLRKARDGLKPDMFKEEYEPEAITDLKDVLLTVEAEFKDHLKECRKILRKPSAQYITVAQDEYLLEIRIADAKVIPNDWVRINGTKSVYRYRSPKMMKLLEERDQALERLAAETDSAFLRFLASISARYEMFRDVVVKLATMDCLLALALVGMLPGYVKPTLVDGTRLEIQHGRHPVVEQLMDKPFIPNDVHFHFDGLRAMVLTGSNMSGKSSLSRMIALLVIMAQIGCRLPCDSATIGIVDYVGTRFGASDEIIRGRSTFMVELTETCEILKAATPRSLIVLDELGRGTSTNDGLAVAQAVLQYILENIKASTIFITHFPQLSEMANKYPVACQLYQMAFVEEEGIDRIPDITFLYKLVPGLTDRVHGISIARMAGLPDSVCSLAANKSQKLEDDDNARQLMRKEKQARTLLSLLAREDVSDARPAKILMLARRIS